MLCFSLLTSHPNAFAKVGPRTRLLELSLAVKPHAEMQTDHVPAAPGPSTVPCHPPLGADMYLRPWDRNMFSCSPNLCLKPEWIQ